MYVDVATPPGAANFQFIYLDNPKGGSGTRKQAKSHVVKESHARSRRRRIAEYQESQRQAVAARQPLVHRQIHADPFDAAARPVSNFEHFLLDHYIRVTVPAANLHNVAYPDPEAYIRGTRTEWIPLALTDPGMLDGVLISACRSLHAFCGGIYLQHALYYKVACLASLSHSIAEDPEPRDVTIAKAIILAGDEAAIGDFPASIRHVRAAQTMIELKGGLGSLGTNKFLCGVASVFSSDQGTNATGASLYHSYSHFRED
ncbi:hypothetical protein BX600DRAFT_475960 [Xylariales sp. PMI_506]|nr:hypothetical protein BX600DRAFT_475960 [Xylariales sp. PMI_506]